MTGEIVRFDYDDAEQRIVVEQRFSEAQDLMRHGLWNLTQAGGKFAEIRDRLAHNKAGGFEGWVASKGLARASVYRLIGLHAGFGNCINLRQLDIDKSAAYLLSAPSTPEPARQEAVERAEAGERITVAKARVLIDNAHATPGEIDEAISDWLVIFDDPRDGLQALVNGDSVIWDDLKACLPRNARRADVMAAARMQLLALKPAPDPTAADDDADPVFAAVEDWLAGFTTDRQRDLALGEVARYGATYQPALRTRLPANTSTREVRRAARTLRGEVVSLDAAPAANGHNGTHPTPAVVPTRPPATKTAPDLSPEELRRALIDLLTLPATATNTDILAAVGTLRAAFEVNHA